MREVQSNTPNCWRRKQGCRYIRWQKQKERFPRLRGFVYLGWIMASTVKGYADAAKRYRICAVCAIGMGRTGTQVDVVRKKNAIPQQIPLFTLQGNFDIEKLHGMYRFMMQMMVKFAGKRSSLNKQNRTPEEDDMLDMMLHGGNRVCIENLHAVLDWYKNC